MTTFVTDRTCDPAEDERLALVARRAGDLMIAGRIVEAEDAAVQALRGRTGTAGEPVARLRLLLASCYFLTRRHVESLDQAEQVLLGTGVPTLSSSQAKLARLRALLSIGNTAAIRRSVEQLFGAEDCTDGALLVGALVATAAMAWDGGQVSEAVSYLRAAVVRSHHRSSFDSYDHPVLYLAATLTSLGEFEDAERLLGELADVGRDGGGDATLVAWVHAHAARLALAAGQLGPAAEHARASLTLSASAGASYYDALATSVLVTATQAAGDTGRARHLADVCRERAAPDIAVLGWAASVWMEVDLAEAQCGHPNALDLLRPSLSRPLLRNRLLLERPHGAAWWVQVALSAGEPKLAAVVLLSIEQLAMMNPGSPSLGAAYSHAMGVWAADLEALDRAATLYRHPWSRAAAMEDGGSIAARARREDAGPRLEKSRQLYAESGATSAATRVERRIRSLSGHRCRGGSPAARSWGWDSLTDSERRVAFTVAEGTTNAQAADRLCLSRHTVDFHLRQIFRKLGIGSRVELARLVAMEDATVLTITGPAPARHAGDCPTALERPGAA